jgi:predicted nucleotide-binding protein
VPKPPAEVCPKDIFVGHGKKKGPLDKLCKLLDQFRIPYKVAEGEPNLGRPIPAKVKQTMQQCGSAILIFTKDEKFFDENGIELWRPSENVVHELGAASYAYEDRVVILKEAGIDLPSNFSSIGYIEFEEGAIESKTADLLKELIGFGLVKIMPAA